MCWNHVTQREPCTCGGSCAHLWPGLCGAAISGALGSGRGCRSSRCRKPHPTDALAELLEWQRAANGGRPPALGAVSAAAEVENQPSRSVWSSAAAAAPGTPPPLGAPPLPSVAPSVERRCTLPPRAARDVLQRRASESAHLAALLTASWLDGALEGDRTATCCLILATNYQLPTTNYQLPTTY